MSVFDLSQALDLRQASPDSRLAPERLLIVAYVLEDGHCVKVTLTVEHPFAAYRDHKFSVINDKLYVDGEQLGDGLQTLGELKCVVVSVGNARTEFFAADTSSPVF